MMKKELCERYIRVINDSRAKEEALGEALQALNADNFIIGLVPDQHTIGLLGGYMKLTKNQAKSGLMVKKLILTLLMTYGRQR
jgi:hypothetical protein